MTVQSNARSNSSFTLWWSLASALSWSAPLLAVAIIAFPFALLYWSNLLAVNKSIIGALGALAALAVPATLICFGGLLGISQNHVLRRFNIKVHNWTRPTQIAGWIGLPIALVISTIGSFITLDVVVPQYVLTAGAVGGMALGGLIGLAQRKKVCAQSSRGWFWVLTSVIAMGVTFPIWLLAGFVGDVVPPQGSIAGQAILDVGFVLLTFLIGGGLYGVITALVLLRMPISGAAID